MTSTTMLPMPVAPKPFALVLDADDPDYADYVATMAPDSPVVWWGAAFADHVLLYRDGDGGRLDTARHSDVDAAVHRWSMLYPLRVEWL